MIATVAKYPVRLYEDILVLPQHAETIIAFRPPILFRSHNINENTLIIASKIAPLIPVPRPYPKVPPYASFLGIIELYIGQAIPVVDHPHNANGRNIIPD
jgi:hypothetical protein